MPRLETRHPTEGMAYHDRRKDRPVRLWLEDDGAILAEFPGPLVRGESILIALDGRRCRIDCVANGSHHARPIVRTPDRWRARPRADGDPWQFDCRRDAADGDLVIDLQPDAISLRVPPLRAGDQVVMRAERFDHLGDDFLRILPPDGDDHEVRVKASEWRFVPRPAERPLAEEGGERGDD